MAQGGNWFTGYDPEEYEPDKEASSLQGAYGAIGYGQDQMQGAQRRQAAQAATGVERYGGATIAQGPQNQMRARQIGLMGQLEAASRGEGPSASAMAADRARDSSLQQSMALQAGRRGAGAASGARVAQRGVALGNQQIMGQEQVGRAQEMAQARSELGGAIMGARGQDIGLATSQAGLTQQGRLASMDAQNQRDSFNAQLRAQQMAQNDQYALGMSGQLGQMSMAEMQARLQQEDWARQNLDQGSSGMLGTMIGLGGQLGAAAIMSDVNSKAGISKGAKWDRLGQSIAGAGGLITAAIGERRDERKQDKKEAAKEAARKEELAASEAAAERRHKENVSAKYLAAGLADPYAQPAAPVAAPAPVVIASSAPRGQYIAGITDQPAPVPGLPALPAYGDGGIVTKPTVALIGEKGPEAVIPLSDKRKAREMLDELTPYEYEYNGTAQAAGMPPGRRPGVMKHDLMKTEMGRTMDAGRDPSTGYGQVDYVKGLPAMAAGLADLNDRLRSLEGKKKGR